jgi:hypothetical protein
MANNADIFGAAIEFGGAFRAQRGIILSQVPGLDGILMQNINISYNRPVQRIYELGIAGQPVNFYYIEGRPQGTMTVAHVIGPGKDMAKYYEQFGNVCKAGENTIALSLTPNMCLPGQGSQAKIPSMNIYATNCVLMAVGISTTADNLIINENSQLMFNTLKISYNTPAQVVAGAFAIAGGIIGGIR